MNRHASALGKLGGTARAKKRRSEIARMGAEVVIARKAEERAASLSTERCLTVSGVNETFQTRTRPVLTINDLRVAGAGLVALGLRYRTSGEATAGRLACR